MKDVLLNFLKCDGEDEFAVRIRDLQDYEFEIATTEYHKERQNDRDNNPVLEWVVIRKKQIKRWIKAIILTDALFSSGVNQRINEDLNRDDVRGNLSRLVASGDTKKHEELKQTRVPSEEFKYLICIYRSKPDRIGSLELVDGFHRAVSMIANGYEKAVAFVAELK